MDERDRQLISGQMDQLVQHTNYRNLMAQCLNRGMLTEAMKVIIEDRYPDEATRHRKLFEKITKRGPTAFQTLLDVCKHSFQNAYNLLKTGNQGHQEEFQSTYHPNRTRTTSANLGNSNEAQIQQRMSVSEEDAKNNNDMVETSDNGEKHKRLVEFKGNVRRRFPVTLAVGPQTHQHQDLEVYEMIKRNRGVVFIVNIINYINNTEKKRNGAEADKDNLVSLFRQLGFIVFYYEDLSRYDFVDLIKELKESKYLLTECFAFYMMAHGNHTKGRDEIHMHDNSVLYVEDDILAPFNNANCGKLIGKPKLFFFSFCRGNQPDFGIVRKAEHTVRDGQGNPIQEASTNVSTYGDMLICYSTVPGFASHRDRNTGTWFVESMCEVWAKHAHHMDVEQLMKLVGKYISTYRADNAMQTLGSEHRGFFKVLYLNPGYYHGEPVHRSTSTLRSFFRRLLGMFTK